MSTNPLTAQIAADQSVLGARRKVFAQLLKFHNMDSDPSPLEGPHILAAVDAMDEERDAVIAATQRVMRESAPPVSADKLLGILAHDGYVLCKAELGKRPAAMGFAEETSVMQNAIAALHPSVVQESARPKQITLELLAERVKIETTEGERQEHFGEWATEFSGRAFLNRLRADFQNLLTFALEAEHLLHHARGQKPSPAAALPPVEQARDTEAGAVKSCPFCNGIDGVTVYPNDHADAGAQMGVVHVDAFYIHCDACGADGPVCDSDGEARVRWNGRRAALPEQESATSDTKRLDHVDEWLDDFEFVERGDIQRHIRCDWFAGDGGGHWFTEGKTFREAIDKSLNHEAQQESAT